VETTAKVFEKNVQCVIHGKSKNYDMASYVATALRLPHSLFLSGSCRTFCCQSMMRIGARLGEGGMGGHADELCSAGGKIGR
jgi:hypothetical protein